MPQLISPDDKNMKNTELLQIQKKRERKSNANNTHLAQRKSRQFFVAQFLTDIHSITNFFLYTLSFVRSIELLRAFFSRDIIKETKFNFKFT